MTGHVSHFGRVDSLWDSAHKLFVTDARACVRGNIRPLEPRPLDAAWLTMASDWFPPPAFARLEPPNGGVSIDLTTRPHRPNLELGDDEWLDGEFEMDNSSAGLAVERGRLVLADGTLVADLMQIRLMAQD